MQPAEDIHANYPAIDRWVPVGQPAIENGSRLPERIALLEAYRDLFPQTLPMHACVQSIVEQLRCIHQQPARACAEPAVFSRSLKSAFAEAAAVFCELQQHLQDVAQAGDPSDLGRKRVSRLKAQESELRLKLDDATDAVRAAWNLSLEEMRRASAA